MAQAEELVTAETKEQSVQGISISGNVLKVDGEEVLAVLGKNVSTDDLKIFGLDNDAQTKETDETQENKVTVTEDSKVQMYHFDGNGVEEVSADIQTTDGNKIKK